LTLQPPRRQEEATNKFNLTVDTIIQERQEVLQDVNANEDLIRGEIEGYKLSQSYARSILMAVAREDKQDS